MPQNHIVPASVKSVKGMEIVLPVKHIMRKREHEQLVSDLK